MITIDWRSLTIYGVVIFTAGIFAAWAFGDSHTALFAQCEKRRQLCVDTLDLVANAWCDSDGGERQAWNKAQWNARDNQFEKEGPK